MVRLVRGALIVALGLPGVILLTWLAGAVTDNRRYAAEVFDPVLRYEAVLAGRRGHRLGAQGRDCSHAVVSLHDDTPPKPPPLHPGRGWYLRFGPAGSDQWQPTPAVPVGDTTRDAVAFCRDGFNPETAQRIETALSQPASWYWRGLVGETVYVCSAPQRIAARIRFGD